MFHGLGDIVDSSSQLLNSFIDEAKVGAPICVSCPHTHTTNTTTTTTTHTPPPHTTTHSTLSQSLMNSRRRQVLRSLSHPHIVQFLGVLYEAKPCPTL